MSQREEASDLRGEQISSGFDRRDVDWRVEQKLARLLAERDLYWRGVSDGFWIVVVLIGIAVMFWPEIKTAAGRK